MTRLRLTNSDLAKREKGLFRDRTPPLKNETNPAEVPPMMKVERAFRA